MSYSEYDVRMKENYEKRSKTSLVRRIPVIIRVDGKAFHTFCRRFKRPYDEFLNNSLNKVMLSLCENIQGTKFAERHSDEISLLLTDFDSLQTDAYFDYNVQKICSVVASMATAEFCRILIKENEITLTDDSVISDDIKLGLDEPWPCFDARCFNLPEHEINNYFWWRMQDAKRNSVSMVAQANFSHKQLQGKSSDEMQEMLWQEKQINWAKLPQGQKIGFYCVRKKKTKEIPKGPYKGKMVERSVWEIRESPSQKSELDEIFSAIEFVKEDSAKSEDQLS